MNGTGQKNLSSLSTRGPEILGLLLASCLCLFSPSGWANNSKSTPKNPLEESSLFPASIGFQQRLSTEAENPNNLVIVSESKNPEQWASLRNPNKQLLDWLRSQSPLSKQFLSEYGRQCLGSALRSLQSLQKTSPQALAKSLQSTIPAEKVSISDIQFIFLFHRNSGEIESANGDCKARLQVRVDSKDFPNNFKTFEHWHRLLKLSNPLNRGTDDFGIEDLKKVTEEQIRKWSKEFKENDEILSSVPRGPAPGPALTPRTSPGTKSSGGTKPKGRP